MQSNPFGSWDHRILCYGVRVPSLTEKRGCGFRRCRQLLRIPVKEIVCCDLKKECFDMAMANVEKVGHFHESLQAQIAGSHCYMHSGNKCTPDKCPDLFICGTPCQPFSMQRSKRSMEGSVRQHAKWSTTFVDLIEWLGTFQPKAGFLEQVLGIDQAESTSDRKTPLSRPVFEFCQL